MNTCRFCHTELYHTFVDLGTAPPCNKMITEDTFNKAEANYPLRAYVCSSCYLAQLPAHVPAEEIFDSEYTYFSGYSNDWLKHCEQYASDMTEMLHLDRHSKVMEVACNDGSLLQYFYQRGVQCLGIEPTANTAAECRKKGIETLGVFFGEKVAMGLAETYGQQDLIVGNNVLAHVPNINDFVRGLAIMLAPGGILTMEFPSLYNLVDRGLWDTIYHEHYSYLSLMAVCQIFAHHGLTVYHVRELPVHGGSLRVYAYRSYNKHTVPVNRSVTAMLHMERVKGLRNLAYYTLFHERVKASKRNILDWFIQAKRLKKQIVGFGAPGKGNTLLNYCGIGPDMLDYVVDDSPHKQGKWLPGSRIEVRHPVEIARTKPDYVVIMPWNWKDEIAAKLTYIRQWGGLPVVLLPKVEVL